MLRAAAVADVEQRLFANGAPLTGGLDGLFVHVPTSPKPPRWLAAIAPYLTNYGTLNLLGQSPAGMMLVRRPAATFVITFGHTWQQLQYQWLELDFGRRVVLNAVPPDKVLEVSSQQVFAKKHLARERAPRASNVSEFALEYDRDVVGALEGVPLDEELGGTLRGSLSLRLSIHFPALPTVLDSICVLFASDAYKKHYPDIDNIVPISDDTLNQQLDGLLDAEIASGVAKTKAALFAPSFLHGDILAADCFAIGRHAASKARSPYLLYGSWENYLSAKKKTPSIALARSTPVHLFDDAGEQIERRSVYECLTYELSHGNDPYVLSSGIWYKAEGNFIKRVNSAIGKIRKSQTALPAWNGTEDEGTYNRRCCASGTHLHFDAKNIHFGGGQSKFEFCDFMDPSAKILFFVKIASRSSGCSHLVEQVRRTEELFFGVDGSFRANLKKVFAQHHQRAKRAWLDQKPRRDDWTLCLVSMGRDKSALPFFAKCSIVRLVRYLEQLGHTVCFASV